MLGSILINGTHLGRKRQLTQILAAHGLGYVFSALGLERFGSLAGALVHLPHQTRPEHVRSALEEMGATSKPHIPAAGYIPGSKAVDLMIEAGERAACPALSLPLTNRF